MQRFLAVISDPVPGREEEYNAWYDDAHLPEVLRIPGFAAARRYAMADDGDATSAGLGARYLTLYDIEGEISTALSNLADYRASGQLTPLPASVEPSSVKRVAFEAIGEWRRG